MPEIRDSDLLQEVKHWNEVNDKGSKLKPNMYFNQKLLEDTQTVLKNYVCEYWNEYAQPVINIGEIGCGGGSALVYLSTIPFKRVTYVGSDITLLRMQVRMTEPLPPNWDVTFVKAPALVPLFSRQSVDVIFCNAALHHMGSHDSIFEWISNSLRIGGLFILIEPSSGNPFARIARRFAGDFHTKGERPLTPYKTRSAAESHGLQLQYEQGLHFVSGAASYLVGSLKIPKRASIALYKTCRGLDALTRSSTLGYKFVHIYERVPNDVTR